MTAHDPYAYPGNAATSQQIAAWMGANARRVGLPPELPVMASLTESGLRNLDYGDRDSVGFFQMRTSIWDEGPYAGYLTDPQKQIEWFLNKALAVRGSDPSLASDPSRWGEWVADVERPAAEYRYRYQLQLGEAVQLLRGDASLPGGAAVSGRGRRSRRDRGGASRRSRRGRQAFRDLASRSSPPRQARCGDARARRFGRGPVGERGGGARAQRLRRARGAVAGHRRRSSSRSAPPFRGPIWRPATRSSSAVATTRSTGSGSISVADTSRSAAGAR